MRPCPPLAAAALLAASLPASAGTYTLDPGGPVRLVVTDSAYSYQLIEKATGAVLVQQNLAQFTIGGSTYSATALTSIAQAGNTLSGTFNLGGSRRADVTFSFLSSSILRVDLAGAGSTTPTAIAEQFVDNPNQHYYGLWEAAYGTGLDNRGQSQTLSGRDTTVNNVFAASARAPFYFTNNKVGVWAETQAAGSYNLAQGTSTTSRFSFSSNALRYDVMYGQTPKAILGQYNTLAGGAAMPPDWAFSTIWWRDDAHSLSPQSTTSSAQGQLVEDAHRLQANHIPAAALWIDRPYGSGNPGRDANVGGWGNMDFDRTAAGFPNPDQMVRDLNAAGLKTMLWVANKANNQLYTEGNPAGYLFASPAYSQTPAADLRIPAAYTWFQGKLNKLMSTATLYDGSTGIKGFKIDRGGEGEMPESVINQNEFLFAKMAYEQMQARNAGDFFLFSRSTFDTARQYAAVWSGDPTTTFAGFVSSVKNGIRTGLINMPMWGSDTGGYSGSAPSKELFARWLGFSAYSPMMEINIGPGRTPWFDYDAPFLAITVKHTQAHQDLIPYNRSGVYEATQTGVPMLRAMLLEFPDDPALANLADQYMFGPSLLVAPVLAAGATSRSVYVPQGNWADYNHRGTIYQSGWGPQSLTINAPLEEIPLLVREGAIIPRGDIVQGNDNWTPGWHPNLRIEVFPSDQFASSFSYYTGSAAAPITCSPATGDLVVALADLALPGVLNVYVRTFTALRLNGTTLADYTYDPASGLLTVPFAAGQVNTLKIVGGQGLFGPAQWRPAAGADSGPWDTPAHWSTGTPDGRAVSALFGSAISAPATVTLTAPHTLKSLTFDNPAYKYALTGAASLTLATSTAATLAVLRSTAAGHEIAAPLIVGSSLTLAISPGQSLLLSGSLNNSPGQSLTVSGGGTLTIQGAQTHGPGALLNVAAGTLNLATNAGPELSLTTAARINLTASQTLRDLTLHPGGTLALLAPATLLEARSLSIAGSPAAPAARLDLGTARAILHTGFDLDQIRQQIHAGYSAGTWTGQGITSTAALPGFAVAYAAGSEYLRYHAPADFAPAHTVVPTDLLLVYALAGDITLDGRLSLDDYLALDSSYRFPPASATYMEGDLNYDGQITPADYALLDTAFAQFDPRQAQAWMALHTAWFGPDYPARIPIPEPAPLTLFAAAAIPLLRPRRRS